MARVIVTASRRGIAVVAVAALTGCGTARFTSPGARSSADFVACRTSQLAITVTRSGAATAVVGGYIGFTNLTRAACRLSGWPTLIGITASGSVITAKRVLTSMLGPNISAPPLVTLHPGALAEAVFTGNEVSGSCASGPLPTFRSLRVTPPGSSEPVLISAWLPSVGTYLPDCGEITVSPVVPSGDLYQSRSS